MLTILITLAALAGVVHEPYLAWTPETSPANELPASVGAPLSDVELASLREAEPPMPYRALTVALRGPDGTLWVGSTQGLMMLEPDAPRWRLFHSRRWLVHDHVDELALAEDGSVWVRTPAGICRLSQVETTLDEKVRRIGEDLRKWHIREGLIGSIRLNEVARPEEGYVQPSDDNDGLWTSLYVAAESFRYAVTGDEQAKRNARQSLEAMMKLEAITGIPGFAARSFVPIDENARERYGGEWHKTADGTLWWKGDTSSDELDGHYFAYAIYYDLVADDDEKSDLRDLVARMTDHIIDHGYYYVGPSGKPTRWGVWAPEKLNDDLRWIVERGINSLEILSHLKVAAHMTGEPRFDDAARELVERHSYHANTVRQKIIWPPRAVNHSDDELAFVAYYPLLLYERDEHLRPFYLASIQRSWEIERPEQSPLFNYIYAAALQANHWTDFSRRPPEAFVAPERYDGEVSARWFREVPSDLVQWRVVNSHRHDLGELIENRFGQKRSRFVLPVAERPLMRWNGDPFELDGGGDGRTRDDGTFILLPYWMGRYHRFLE